MLRTAFITLTLGASPALAGGAGPDTFCIQNASHETHLFVTETREGVRESVMLDPGQTLCSSATAAPDGVVNVFESPDALEGCGRILTRGETERFIAYAEFDRCEWGAHGS